MSESLFTSPRATQDNLRSTASHSAQSRRNVAQVIYQLGPLDDFIIDHPEITDGRGAFFKGSADITENATSQYAEKVRIAEDPLSETSPLYCGWIALRNLQDPRIQKQLKAYTNKKKYSPRNYEKHQQLKQALSHATRTSLKVITVEAVQEAVPTVVAYTDLAMTLLDADAIDNHTSKLVVRSALLAATMTRHADNGIATLLRSSRLEDPRVPHTGLRFNPEYFEIAHVDSFGGLTCIVPNSQGLAIVAKSIAPQSLQGEGCPALLQGGVQTLTRWSIASMVACGMVQQADTSAQPAHQKTDAHTVH